MAISITIIVTAAGPRSRLPTKETPGPWSLSRGTTIPELATWAVAMFRPPTACRSYLANRFNWNWPTQSKRTLWTRRVDLS